MVQHGTDHPPPIIPPNQLPSFFAQVTVAAFCPDAGCGSLVAVGPGVWTAALLGGKVAEHVGAGDPLALLLGEGEFFSAALPQADRGVTVVHSDRGWQYQHHAFRNLLRDHGVKQSMSRSGNCYDNAITENFFSHFKQGFLRGCTFNLGTFADELDLGIEWFNTKRIRLGREGSTPPW